jgi:hypothetical protein
MILRPRPAHLAIAFTALALGCTQPTDKPEDCTRDEFFDAALQICQRCPALAAPRCLPGCGFSISPDTRGCAATVCDEGCDLCPPWAFFSDASLSCQDCPADQRFDASLGRCVDCPAGQRYDRVQLACVPGAPAEDMSMDTPPDLDMPADMTPELDMELADMSLDMEQDMSADMSADMAEDMTVDMAADDMPSDMTAD